MTQTLSLGPLSLLAEQHGPLLTITIHAPSDSAPVGKMTLTIPEWTGLVALVDCMVAAEKRHAEDKAEIERLTALTMNPGATLHGSTITEIAADRDSLRQQVRELTEERDAYRHAARLAEESARLYDLLGEELEQIVGGDGTSLERLRRLESERDRLRSDLSAALTSVDAMAERIEQMRPVYEAAIKWLDGNHTGDANCSAGDCDDCEARTLEGVLRVRIAEVLGREPDRWDLRRAGLDTALAHTAREQAKGGEMSRRINENEWHSERIGGRVHEVCVSTRTGEIVILGSPDHDDESHNCDFMGCGQSHVLWRRRP